LGTAPNPYYGSQL